MTLTLSMDQQLAKNTTRAAFESDRAALIQEYDDAVMALQLGILMETNTYNVEGVFDYAVNTCLWQSDLPYEHLSLGEKLAAVFSEPTQQLQEFQTSLVALGWHDQQSQIKHLKQLRNALSKIRQPISIQSDGFHVTNTNLTPTKRAP